MNIIGPHLLGSRGGNRFQRCCVIETDNDRSAIETTRLPSMLITLLLPLLYSFTLYGDYNMFTRRRRSVMLLLIAVIASLAVSMAAASARFDSTPAAFEVNCSSSSSNEQCAPVARLNNGAAAASFAGKYESCCETVHHDSSSSASHCRDQVDQPSTITLQATKTKKQRRPKTTSLFRRLVAFIGKLVTVLLMRVVWMQLLQMIMTKVNSFLAALTTLTRGVYLRIERAMETMMRDWRMHQSHGSFPPSAERLEEISNNWIELRHHGYQVRSKGKVSYVANGRVNAHGNVFQMQKQQQSLWRRLLIKLNARLSRTPLEETNNSTPPAEDPVQPPTLVPTTRNEPNDSVSDIDDSLPMTILPLEESNKISEWPTTVDATPEIVPVMDMFLTCDPHEPMATPSVEQVEQTMTDANLIQDEPLSDRFVETSSTFKDEAFHEFQIMSINESLPKAALEREETRVTDSESPLPVARDASSIMVTAVEHVMAAAMQAELSHMSRKIPMKAHESIFNLSSESSSLNRILASTLAEEASRLLPTICCEEPSLLLVAPRMESTMLMEPTRNRSVASLPVIQPFDIERTSVSGSSILRNETLPTIRTEEPKGLPDVWWAKLKRPYRVKPQSLTSLQLAEVKDRISCILMSKLTMIETGQIGHIQLKASIESKPIVLSESDVPTELMTESEADNDDEEFLSEFYKTTRRRRRRRKSATQQIGYATRVVIGEGHASKDHTFITSIEPLPLHESDSVPFRDDELSRGIFESDWQCIVQEECVKVPSAAKETMALPVDLPTITTTTRPCSARPEYLSSRTWSFVNPWLNNTCTGTADGTETQHGSPLPFANQWLDFELTVLSVVASVLTDDCTSVDKALLLTRPKRRRGRRGRRCNSSAQRR